MKKANILIDVILDNNNIPDRITWTAPDGKIFNYDTRSIFLSFWDHEKQEALKIDLWTKKMTINDMKKFYHQIFISMYNSYLKATDDTKIANKILDFANKFAVDSNII